MKIVILQGAYLPVPPILGGAVEKMWYKLGIEFSKMGHDVCQISKIHKNSPVEEVQHGVRHIRVQGFNAPKSKIIYKILDAIYTWRAIIKIPEDAEICITNTFWAPILLSKKKKLKVYVDVARMPKGQMKLYKNAARLRANSTAVVEAIKKELEPKAQNKIKMIPNPLPFEGTSSNEDSKANIILYCGRVHKEKGLELLASATSLLTKNNWKLKIIGPWETTLGGSGLKFKQKLQSQFENMNVEFLGPIFDEELLNEHYKSASIFVYPSLAEKGETFGLAPLEAMAWGSVPVVSDLECFKDFITDQHNGLIFNHRSNNAAQELANSINKLITDSTHRNLMSIRARKVVISHSTSSIAKQFLEDFISLETQSNSM